MFFYIGNAHALNKDFKEASHYYNECLTSLNIIYLNTNVYVGDCHFNLGISEYENNDS